MIKDKLIIEFKNNLIELWFKIEETLNRQIFINNSFNMKFEQNLFQKHKTVSEWIQEGLDDWYTELINKLPKEYDCQSLKLTVENLNQVTINFSRNIESIYGIDVALTWILESPYLLESNLYLEV